MWIHSQEELRPLNDNVYLLKEQPKIISLPISVLFTPAPNQIILKQSAEEEKMEFFNWKSTSVQGQQKAELLY